MIIIEDVISEHKLQCTMYMYTVLVLQNICRIPKGLIDVIPLNNFPCQLEVDLSQFVPF